MSQWNPSSGDWEHAEPHWAQDDADPGPPGGDYGWGGDQPEPRYPVPPDPADPYPPPTQPPMMSAPPIWEDSQPPKAYLWQQPEPPGGGRRVRTAVAVIAVVIFLAAGGAALAVELRSHGSTGAAPPSHGTSHSPAQGPSTATPGQATPTAVPTRARPSPPASPGAGATGIAVTSAAAGNPAAPQVVNFLGSYFRAINTHDYPAFRRLLDPAMQRIETAQKFAAGFRSTFDSGAVLLSLTTPVGGRLAAAMSFTSHQAPADSPDHSACTSWAITLYLEPTDTGYVIGLPPASYQARHQPCPG
jgi:hypothetical protein